MMAMTGAPPRSPTTRALLGLAIGLAGTAASITMMFLAMRAVMGVGGSCAEGGPYVIATPCPEGATAAMLIGIFALFGAWAVAAVFGPRVGGIWSASPIFGWSGLFVALGWNFLEAGFAADGGLDLTGLLLGGMFWAMGLVPLVVALWAVRAGSRSSSTQGRTARLTSPRSGLASDARGDAVARTDEDRPFAPGPLATDGHAMREQLLAAIATDLATATTPPHDASDAGGRGPGPGRDTAALVAHLEKLADLRSRGMLDEDAYQAAKTAIVNALEKAP